MRRASKKTVEESTSRPKKLEEADLGLIQSVAESVQDK